MAYSIVKHNLFDADTLIHRTVGYVVVTAIVVGVYLADQSEFKLLPGRV